MRGPDFQEVHELLDEVVEHAREYADTAAERVVALGLPSMPALAPSARRPRPRSCPRDSSRRPSLIKEMIAALDATIATVRTAVDELKDLDPVSQDVAIEIARGLDKDRWFLFSHIAK